MKFLLPPGRTYSDGFCTAEIPLFFRPRTHSHMHACGALSGMCMCLRRSYDGARILVTGVLIPHWRRPKAMFRLPPFINTRPSKAVAEGGFMRRHEAQKIFAKAGICTRRRRPPQKSKCALGEFRRRSRRRAACAALRSPPSLLEQRHDLAYLLWRPTNAILKRQ